MSSNGGRRGDSQQWILDWLVKTTGRVQNFAYDQRVLPPEVKTYRQIPRVVERYARHAEELARAAEDAGHRTTARDLYWIAAGHYHEAQHAIFVDDDPEKIYLHGKLLDCYSRMIENGDARAERVEIPFGDEHIQGVLHLARADQPAPTAVFCPGMDMVKESHMPPWDHPFTSRGLNCLHIDGPGQGTSNIRKIRVSVDNYEAAGSAAIDYLADRPEVDGERIVVSGSSMGSYWAMRLAATDRRVRAVATCAACYGPKRAIFEQASPRFKQMFMYMSGVHEEPAFDRMAAEMRLDALAPLITCPTLQVVGEYDPLSDLDDVIAIYGRVAGPKELWVIEDDFHIPRFTPNFAGGDFYGYLADWLNDAIAGRKPPDLDRQVLIRRDGLGPYGREASSRSELKLPGRAGATDATLTAAQAGPAVAGTTSYWPTAGRASEGS